MFRDDIPTIQLGSWPVSATMLDGDKLAGLFPTLFSEEPEVGRFKISRTLLGLTRMLIQRSNPENNRAISEIGCINTVKTKSVKQKSLKRINSHPPTLSLYSIIISV